MAKPQYISAKKFVKDLRDGLTNSRLMEKYNLTREQLNRAFQQLIDGNVMTGTEVADLTARRHSTVDVRAFAADFQAGMAARELMHKYSLNPADYYSMMDKARRVRPVPEAPRDEVTVQVRQNAKRRINAREFAEDVQLGMDHHNLMEKYDITEIQLEKVLDKLIEARLLTEAEVYDRTVPFDTQLMQAQLVAQASIDELD